MSHSILKLATIIFTLAIALAGCSNAAKVETYSGNAPRFVPEDFFNGDLIAKGLLKNRKGEVTRRFEATIKGTWADGVGTLYEEFTFDDGEQQTRTWVMRAQGKGANANGAVRHYLAEANDVTGLAPVSVSGNAMFLKYVLNVPYKGDTISVNVDDRMFLIDEKLLINESIMTKFGFRVGTIVLTIYKP